MIMVYHCTVCGKEFQNKSGMIHIVCRDCIERIGKQWADTVRGKHIRMSRCIVCGSTIQNKQYKMTCSVKCAHIMEFVRDRYRASHLRNNKIKKQKIMECSERRRNKQDSLNTFIANIPKGLSYGKAKAMKYFGLRVVGYKYDKHHDVIIKL